MSLSIDHKLIESYNQLFPQIKEEKSQLSKALMKGDGQRAQEIIDSITKNGLSYTQQELWQIKVFKNLAFDDKDFLSLSPEIQNLVYRTANNFKNIPLVSHLNSLRKYGLEEQPIKSPSIVSELMDIATVNQTISKYLIKLRKENRLLTKDEFSNLKLDGSWLKKSQFGRILGCDHLSHLIENLNLKRIKVPEKKAVIESNGSAISLSVEQCGDDLTDIRSREIYVYAQEIKQVKRFLSREEVIELFIIIEASNYLDLNVSNFIVASDGIYLIDTEFKSFSGYIEWGKMGRLGCFVHKEDHQWFEKLIIQKMDDSKKKQKPLSFQLAGFCLENLKEKVQKQVAEESIDKELITLMINCKRTVKQGKLVGSDRNRVFSFPMQEILSTNK